MATKLRRGVYFRHAQWTEAGWPLLCKVTRVAEGAIYYRPVYENCLGKPVYFLAAEADKYIKEIL
jgi:hypothetical protein